MRRCCPLSSSANRTMWWLHLALSTQELRSMASSMITTSDRNSSSTSSGAMSSSRWQVRGRLRSTQTRRKKMRWTSSDRFQWRKWRNLLAQKQLTRKEEPSMWRAAMEDLLLTSSLETTNKSIYLTCALLPAWKQWSPWRNIPTAVSLARVTCRIGGGRATTMQSTWCGVLAT